MIISYVIFLKFIIESIYFVDFILLWLTLIDFGPDIGQAEKLNL